MAVGTPGGQAPLTSVHVSSLRRRPTGEPPPLPRQIGRTGRLLVALIVFGATITIATVFVGSGTAIPDRSDGRLLAWLARTEPAG